MIESRFIESSKMNLSIIIPSYNEGATVAKIIEKIFDVDFGNISFEVIFVNDGSTDNTQDVIHTITAPIKVISHDTVQGKSAAVRTGLSQATGEYVITQDADLELDPQDIVTLYTHAVKNNLPVLYGSRRAQQTQRDAQQKTIFYRGAVLVTNVTNLLFGSNITDEPTCYKLIKRELLLHLNLSEEKFAYCPEVTAKMLKLGYTITELPISYYPRSVAEGKKIRWKDGLHAIWVLVKYRCMPVTKWQSK